MRVRDGRAGLVYHRIVFIFGLNVGIIIIECMKYNISLTLLKKQKDIHVHIFIIIV